ncbi:MAG: protein phosphatase 2C domain-containing protein [Armatimonadetes bacterium]|nr:protein phosphatase 2C domain-containing protein [Armatimonadota bacterium]
MAWTFASATRLGTVHSSGPCQDFAACMAKGNSFVAVVADGAGSAEFGAEGAETVCKAFLDASKKLLRNPAKAKDATIKDVVVSVITAVEARAKSKRKPVASFSSTMVGVVVGSNTALVVQIGDGAAVLEVDGQFHVPVWPNDSEFLNATCFVTSPAAREHVAVARIDRRVDTVAAFSDGLQLLVLDGKTRTAHEPFFASVRNNLATLEGHDERASDWLGSVLASNPVTSRTDDDTCLVIGRRTRGGQ